MEGSEQSHSVSSGTVPDPQDLKRDLQLASTRLPSTLDEGTRKLKPLPESTPTHPKDSGGNKQPLDRDLTSTTSDEATTKTTPFPEGSLWDKDLRGNIPPVDMKPIHTPVADPSGSGAKYQVDETQSTRLSDLYKSLNVITELLKDINNAVKDDLVTKKKIDEAIKTFTKISTQTTKILSFVKTFDFATVQSTMKDLQAHALIQEEASATWMKQDTSEINSMMAEIYQDLEDKEEKMKKDTEEAKLLSMSRPEVIKVVLEEAKKLRIDLKEAYSTKAGEHLRKLRMLSMKSSRESTLKRIHPNTKPIVTPMGAYEVDETQSSVVVRDKDARIQKKSNGLVTSKKEPVKTVRTKKTPKSRRNGS
uniref:Uncharacterized protein n=1 Tax=Tanacetum cinerariifolium TaxID=118510 RepID=A0A699IK46_TANCI|nr:hypothetical protein [Tanacetum cinerariifolium]